MRRTPRAVLFDLDGTFVDTAPDMAQALNDIRLRRQLPPLSIAQVRPHVSRGARGMIDIGFGISAEHPQFTGLRDEFLDHYATQLCVRSALFAGMAEVIDGLDQRAIAWGIVTNKALRYALPIALQLGFHARCAAFVCGDTTAHAKPHPAPLLHAATTMQIEASQCWYVGDDERDMRAAQSAGMVGIVAAYGYLGGTPHQTWPAAAVIESPRALLPLIANH